MKNPFAGVWAALFDLDGTLVETHIDFPLMKREMLALAAAYGLDAEGLAGMDILSVVEAGREQLAGGDAGAAARFRAEAFARLEEIEVSQCGAPVEVRGAADLLATLEERGVRVGIVTRNCRRVSEQLIRFAGLRCHALLTRDDVAVTKPDPEHLHAAVEALGVRRWALETDLRRRIPNAVMVGDHLMDIQAGRAAGMRTVGVLHQREAGFFDSVAPDLVVPHISDLLPLAPQGPTAERLTPNPKP